MPDRLVVQTRNARSTWSNLYASRDVGGQLGGGGAMNRILVAVGLLVSAVGSAQAIDLPDVSNSVGFRPQPGGPAMVDDTVRAGNLSLVHKETDFVIRTSLGDLALTRSFSTEEVGVWGTGGSVWPAQGAITHGRWFGNSKHFSDQNLAGQWKSSLEGNVVFRKGDPAPGTRHCTIKVAGPSGDTATYNEDSDTYCDGVFPLTSGGRISHPSVLGVSNTVAYVTRSTGEREAYTANLDAGAHLLTSIYPSDHYATNNTTSWGTELAKISYPSTYDARADWIDIFGGERLEIVWNGDLVSEVKLWDVGATSGVTVMNYYYDGQDRLICAQNALTNTTSQYEYSGANGDELIVTRWEGGVGMNVSSTRVDGPVILLAPPMNWTSVPTVSSNATPEGVSSFAPNAATATSTAWWSTATTNTLSGTLVKTFRYNPKNGLTTRLQLANTGTSVTTVRNADSEWGIWRNNNPSLFDSYSESSNAWTKDFVGNYVVSGADLNSFSPNPSNPVADIFTKEVRSVLVGASTDAGIDPLMTTTYAYQYANTRGVHERLPSTTTVASVFNPTHTVTTRYRYDLGSKRLNAIFRTGYTQRLNKDKPPDVVQATIATFYFNTYVCDQETSPDQYNRTVEVHGPCFVSNGDSPTDCDPALNANIPVKQYRFWSISETNNNAGRLRYVLSYPSTLTGSDCRSTRSPVTTSFDTYDGFGHVLSETDANGVSTTRTYQGDRLLSETKAGATTRYFYNANQGGQLSSKRLPDGTWEIFCYRVGDKNKCDSGALSSHVQWSAHVASLETVNEPVWPWTIVDRKDYEYSGPGAETGSGLLTTQTSSKDLRIRIVRHEYDALGRETATHAGFEYTSRALFDENGNQVASGAPYNEAPEACGGFGSPSDKCTWTDYDRMNRPSSTKSPDPILASADNTYDPQGNLVSVEQVSSGLQTAVYYDDFANVVFSYSQGTGVNTQFDARGNVVKKQSNVLYAHSQYLEFTYDSMNRPLRAVSPDGANLLWQYGYDKTNTAPPTNCPALATSNTMGRVQWKDDSFGRTWFEYDELGHVLAERRVRDGVGPSCSVVGGTDSTDDTPDTRYTYSLDGRLLTMKYPHGLNVGYIWGDAVDGRSSEVVSIAKLDVYGAFESYLLSDIRYDVDGSVEAYQLGTAEPVSVEWVRKSGVGKKGGVGECHDSRPKEWDGTGRLQEVLVSHGDLSQEEDSRNGEIFKMLYGWKADQITDERQCLLNEDQGVLHSYSYDSSLQLTNGSVDVNAVSANSWQSRRYYYSDAAERGAAGEDGAWFLSFIDVHHRVESYVPRAAPACIWCPDTSWRRRDYGWDNDSRMIFEHDTPTPYNVGGYGFTSWGRDIEFNPDDGLGTVYRAVVMAGGTYEYYYDAAQRRRLKVYPGGQSDEYFYSGENIIEDRGVPSFEGEVGRSRTMDQYVWLAGMPVAVVKVQFDRNGDPYPEMCLRNDEEEPCGTFFIVNDGLPKAVALIDSNGLLSGAAEYDPFGRVNTTSRMVQPASEPVCGSWAFGSYSPKQTSTLLTIPWLPRGDNYRLDARINYATVSTSGPSDRAWVESASGHLTSDVYGLQYATNSEWFEIPGTETAQLIWEADGTAEESCIAPRAGVVVSGFEYRHHHADAAARWIPLRFPGQYFDAETGLHENWNRFYDPELGQYSAIDPLAMASALNGSGRNGYVYAANNPHLFVDVNGLKIKYYNANGIEITVGAYAEGRVSDADMARAAMASEAVDVMASVSDEITGAPDVTGIGALRDAKDYILQVQFTDSVMWNGRMQLIAGEESGPTLGPVGAFLPEVKVYSDTPNGSQSSGHNGYNRAQTFLGVFVHELGHAATRYENWRRTGAIRPSPVDESNGNADYSETRWLMNPRSSGPWR